MLDDIRLLLNQLIRNFLWFISLLEAVLPSFNISPTEGACDIASAKRGGLNAKMTLYPKIMLVALSSTTRAQALSSPVTSLVCGVLVLAN
jgi:hypothetical protein